MQIKSLRFKSYNSWKIDETKISNLAKQKRDKILLYGELRENGCSETIALKAIQMPRASFYRIKCKYKKDGIKGLEHKSCKPNNYRKRQWSKKIYMQILKLRREYPYWGKCKLHKILTRDYNSSVSIATVGRIISDLIASKKITTVAKFVGRNKNKRKRNFKNHAKRWKYGMKGKIPGELIQIDHMSVYNNGYCVKHFKAICPVTRIMVAEVYSKATSNIAKTFLAKVISNLPFTIKSIQVDGGSEFMKHFEESCKEKNIPLFVLPPKSPKYNGTVERCNGTARTEFYSLYTGEFNVLSIRKQLKIYNERYNTFRPHQSLGLFTPMGYFISNYQEVSKAA